MVSKERKRATQQKPNKNIIRADRVGDTRLHSAVSDVLVHPDATPLHQIPQSDEEVVLSKSSNFLGKGHYGAAIPEAKTLKIPPSTLISSI